MTNTQSPQKKKIINQKIFNPWFELRWYTAFRNSNFIISSLVTSLLMHILNLNLRDSFTQRACILATLLNNKK